MRTIKELFKHLDVSNRTGAGAIVCNFRSSKILSRKPLRFLGLQLLPLAGERDRFFKKCHYLIIYLHRFFLIEHVQEIEDFLIVDLDQD
jgi:hypothetical protein